MLQISGNPSFRPLLDAIHSIVLVSNTLLRPLKMRVFVLAFKAPPPRNYAEKRLIFKSLQRFTKIMALLRRPPFSISATLNHDRFFQPFPPPVYLSFKFQYKPSLLRTFQDCGSKWDWALVSFIFRHTNDRSSTSYMDEPVPISSQLANQLYQSSSTLIGPMRRDKKEIPPRRLEVSRTGLLQI